MKRELDAADSGRELSRLPIEVDVDQILRAQGADPEKLRARQPRAVELAERALREGSRVMEPRVLCRELAVQGVLHERIRLSGGGELRGGLVAQQLGAAERIVVIVATLGEKLDALSTEMQTRDISFALALDGFGTAAIEALSMSICRHFGEVAEREGMHSSLPFSPGMAEWDLQTGQRGIFGLLDSASIGLRLSPSFLMIPQKSLSLVIGIGREVREGGSLCEFCNLRETCRHRSL